MSTASVTLNQSTTGGASPGLKYPDFTSRAGMNFTCNPTGMSRVVMGLRATNMTFLMDKTSGTTRYLRHEGERERCGGFPKGWRSYKAPMHEELLKKLIHDFALTLDFLLSLAN
jgi:hypothetical protein